MLAILKRSHATAAREAAAAKGLKKRGQPTGADSAPNSKAAKTARAALHSGIVKQVVKLLQEQKTSLADILNSTAGGRAFPELSGLQATAQTRDVQRRRHAQVCGITQQEGATWELVARGRERNDPKVLHLCAASLRIEFQGPFVCRQSKLSECRSLHGEVLLWREAQEIAHRRDRRAVA
jgi:hypothetical protein